MKRKEEGSINEKRERGSESERKREMIKRGIMRTFKSS